MNDEATPGIGHNLTPEEQAFSDLTVRADDLITTANLWLLKRPEFTDEEMAAKGSDFMEQLSKLAKRVEAYRTDQLEPHKVAVAEINDKCHPLHQKGKKTGRIDVALRLLNVPMTAWLKKVADEKKEAAAKAEAEALEKIRLADEAKKKAATETEDIVGATVAAEQAAEQADEAAKDADALAKSRAQVHSHSGGGRTKSLRTTWNAYIIDYDAALKHYAGRSEVREVAQRLANADARNPETRREGPPPGVEFYEEKTAA